MKILFRMMVTIGVLVALTACGSTNDDGNQSDLNNEDEAPDEQIEDNEHVEEEPKEDNDVNDNEDQEQPPNESEIPDKEQNIEKDEIVLENEAFQVFEPTPNAEVKDQIVVRGLARVFEGTLNYEFEDGHFLMDEGFTTASKGGPEWGEFEIVIETDGAVEGEARVILFELSAKDGSRIHELIIPVYVSK